jgi:hypothetical protein
VDAGATAMSPDSNDWRLAVQHDYLKGRAWIGNVYRKPRPKWDHDHCAFCWAESMEPGTPDTLNGYASADDYYWACHPCFDDFREIFRWTVIGRLS